MNRREWRWVVSMAMAIVTASSLPYLVAWMMTPEHAHFTGLVFNPQDGNSYVAKMRQGFEGFWRFRLPYTPEPHEGAPVYLFYLFLGHVARWTGLSLVVVYHAARALGGGAMLLAVYGLASRLTDRSQERSTMFLLTSVGSGLGWLVGMAGVETADLWVPEAFPAYALLTNAHFPLAMGLMAGIAVCGLNIMPGRETEGQRSKANKAPGWAWGLGMVVMAVALGVIQPFGLVAPFGGLGVVLAVRAVRERAIPWRAAAWVAGVAAAALPYPLYAQWAIGSDPVLAAWNAQNVTPSPPLWDWALSYGLVLALAVLGSAAAARRGSDGDVLLLGWVVMTLGGMYLPLSLQRRLSLGLGVPLGLLAGMGWWRGVRPRIQVRRRQLLKSVAITLSGLTPVFLMLIALVAARAGEPWFYLSGGEWDALTWLRGQSDALSPERLSWTTETEPKRGAVVLCAPQMGSFVPAWAGQPVVYGHPFETVNADLRKAQVEAYWTGEMSAKERAKFLRKNHVRYVLVGPREKALGAEAQRIREGGELVLEAGATEVYETDE